MECGHDENYYYEYCEEFAEYDYFYYPMIMTNVSKLGDYEELVGIWQKGSRFSGLKHSPTDKVPYIYEPYSWTDGNYTTNSYKYSHYLPMRPVVTLPGNTRVLSKDYIIEKMCEDVSSLYWRGANKLYDPNADYKYYEKNEDGQWYYISWRGIQVLTEEEWNKKILDLYDIKNKKFKYNNMYYQNDEEGWFWFDSYDGEKMYAGSGIEGIRNILEDFTMTGLTLLVN